MNQFFETSGRDQFNLITFVNFYINVRKYKAISLENRGVL